MTDGKTWRPSRTDSHKLEYGTIERAEREIFISEACDILNALEARAALVDELTAALEDIGCLAAPPCHLGRMPKCSRCAALAGIRGGSDA